MQKIIELINSSLMLGYCQVSTIIVLLQFYIFSSRSLHWTPTPLEIHVQSKCAQCTSGLGELLPKISVYWIIEFPVERLYLIEMKKRKYVI